MDDRRPIAGDLERTGSAAAEALRGPGLGNWLLVAAVAGTGGLLAAVVAASRLAPAVPVAFWLPLVLVGGLLLFASVVGLTVWRLVVSVRAERRRMLVGHLRCAHCRTLGEFGTVCKRCGALHPLPEEAGIHPVYGTWPGEGGPPICQAPPKDGAAEGSSVLR